MNPRFTRRRFLATTGSAVLLPMLAGCLDAEPTPSGDGPSGGPAPSGHDAPGGSCDLPLFTDEYVGFNVGLPQGWKLDYTRGTIWLWPAEAARSIVAFVYPIRPLQTLTPDQITASYVRSLNAGIGGTLSVTDGGRLTGTVGGVGVTGAIRLQELQSDYVVWGGFGVPDAWRRWEDDALAIGACYRPRPGRLLTRGTATGSGQFGTTQWHYVLPSGWFVERPSDLEIHILGDWNPAIEAYNAHIGRVLLTHLTVDQRTPALVAEQYATRLSTYSGWRLVEWTSQGELVRQTNEDGSVTSTQAFGYEARSSLDYPLTGVLAASVRSGAYSTGASVAVREALSSEWNRLAAITSYVMNNTASGAFELRAPPGGNDVADIALDVYAQREAVMDEAAGKWEENIMWFDTLQDPTTGTIHEVSRNNWDPTSGCPSGYVHPERGYPDCLVAP